MISIICVYNDKKILDDWLIKSLQNQTVKFELITIDNTQGRFKSSAEALNYGGKKATGKYLMFVHQDVDLCSSPPDHIRAGSWLEDAEKMLDLIPNLGIAGVAGVSEKGKNYLEKMRNVIKHGTPPNIIGTPIKTSEPVQTLDECLVIIPRQVFEKLRFDETTCNDWHLYATDYCLSIRRRLGLLPYVIPCFIYHRSYGDLSKGYYKTLQKLLRKHRGSYKKIYSTCGFWDTKQPVPFQRVAIWIKAVLFGYGKKLGLTPLWRRLQYLLSKYNKK